MLVSEMLKANRADVVSAKPGDSVDTAARLMKLENIGALVVSENGVSVDGIISERDIVRGLTVHGAATLGLPVSDLMTPDVLTCGPGDNVKDIMRRMTTARVRHIPVVEERRLRGVVSIGDVVKNRLELMELEANVLRDQLVAHA